MVDGTLWLTRRASKMRPAPPTLTKTCATCGHTFPRKTDVTYAQWAKAAYCSRACQSRAPRARGSAHHHWCGGEQTKRCEYCASLFTVRPYRADIARFWSARCKQRGQDRGLSTENEKVRRCHRYREWRRAVFMRDNFTCQACGQRGGRLNADHIEPFAFRPDLRFELSNGRTLCGPCHRKTPTYGTTLMWQRRQKDIVTDTKGF
jgi:5-methylcytosine-specific restriction endonuclease McrA